jgi:hypothetical protein
MIKLQHRTYRIWFNILRILKAALGAIGMTFVVTDYKWLGVGVLVAAAVCNEAIAIIKDEDDNSNA